jgi:flagellar hook-associated protein FlgK
MQNFSIGLSGLNAASSALEVIGNNIANASTEGYHRQRVELTPTTYGQMAGGGVGAGVDVSGVTRLVDKLLESEIMQQGANYAQISQELSILTAVETTFGEFAEGSGLNATIDAFFDSLRGLAAHPLERVWRNDVVSSAEVLCSEFRRIGTSLSNLEDQVLLEAKNTGDSINSLTTQIAELNGKIQTIEISQGQANNLRDHRDQMIAELATLASVETQEREYGIVDVSIGGLPVVTGGITVGVQVSLLDDGSLGVTAANSSGYSLPVQGGRLGALMALKNELLVGTATELDNLAKAIVDSVNACHVQGLGVDGSFTELGGATIDSQSLVGEDAGVTDGTFYVRVTNTATGEIERYAIDVDASGASPDTSETIAAKIDAVPGLSVSILSSRLHIVADLGYTFDFLPAVLPEPTAATLTAASPPTIRFSGIYSGQENDAFTFTVAGSGSVGNGDLRLDVTDGNGNLVSTLNIGKGYAAGDAIELYNGIQVAVSTGNVNAGDSFETLALATSDTSGFLAAAGMNTFFSGSSAGEMQVVDEIADAPDRIATAYGADLTDNTAALRLAAVRDEGLDGLTGMTPSEYYHRIVANVGQQVDLRESRQSNVEAMIQNLESRRSEISGVNINDEAAQLMIFEKMFQAMAKYLSTLQSTMNTLMDMV